MGFRSIELRDLEEDDTNYLHFSREHAEEICDSVADFIEQKVRDLNKDDPDAATKLLCGGCYRTLILNLILTMTERGIASNAEAVMEFAVLRLRMEEEIVSTAGIDALKDAPMDIRRSAADVIVKATLEDNETVEDRAERIAKVEAKRAQAV